MFNMFFLFGVWLSVAADLTYGFSVMPCTRNTTNVALDLHNGPVKGYCRFIENNAHHHEEQLHNGNVYTFLGIPYAEPPIKQNRFKRTIEKENWSEVLDATRWSNVCMQQVPEKSDDLFAGFKMWHHFWRSLNMSEDCLYLNIWLPLDAFIDAKSTVTPLKRHPILVFFHGSGSLTDGGSAALDLYDPSTFVAAKSIIVITVNYRLGVFGSIYSEDLDFPGNQALYDQTEALKWIRKNAESFGGDADRVTVAGHGSGAVLAGQLLFVKESWDYFDNLILQSGTPLLKSLVPISRQEASQRAQQVFSLAGCANSYGNQLECVQTSESIFNASLDAFRQSIEGNTITELYLRTYYPFVIDNYLLTDLPENLLKRGDFKRCPVLTGFTANEGSLTLAKSGLFGFKSTELKRQQNVSHNDMANFLNEFFAYYPSYPHLMNKIISDLILHEYTKLTNLKDDLNLPIALMKTNYFQELSKIIADQSIVCPTYKLSDALAKYGSNVFLYLYSHRVSSSAWPVWYGAVNGDELAFTFGHTIANNNNKPRSVNSLNPWANSKHYYTNNEKILTKEMLGYWANFVRSGDPNNEWDTIKWPTYTLFSREDDTVHFSQSGQYMVFKINGTKISRGYSLEQCKFWSSYLPSLVDEHERILKENAVKSSVATTGCINSSSKTMKLISSTDRIQQIERKSELKDKIEEQDLITTSKSSFVAALSSKQAIYLEKPAVSEQFNNKCSFFKSSKYFLFVLTVLFLFRF